MIYIHVQLHFRAVIIRLVIYYSLRTLTTAHHGDGPL